MPVQKRLFLLGLVAILCLSSNAEARRHGRYRAKSKPKPAPISKKQCWLFVTLDVAGRRDAPASIDLCSLGLSPDLLKQILGTYGKTPGQPLGAANKPFSSNILMEISMRICSRWYATQPGKLSFCANQKLAQLIQKAQSPARLYPGVAKNSTVGIPTLPGQAFPLPPPKKPLYADLEKNELARAQRFCRLTHGQEEGGQALCLERQVTRMREFLDKDKSLVGESDMLRSRKHCERLSGDDRESFYGCMLVEVDRILRFQAVDTSGLQLEAVGRAEALCTLRYGDDRGNHYYCLSQEIRRLKTHSGQ